MTKQKKSAENQSKSLSKKIISTQEMNKRFKSSELWPEAHIYEEPNFLQETLILVSEYLSCRAQVLGPVSYNDENTKLESQTQQKIDLLFMDQLNKRIQYSKDMQILRNPHEKNIRNPEESEYYEAFENLLLYHGKVKEEALPFLRTLHCLEPYMYSFDKVLTPENQKTDNTTQEKDVKPQAFFATFFVAFLEGTTVQEIDQESLKRAFVHTFSEFTATPHLDTYDLNLNFILTKVRQSAYTANEQVHFLDFTLAYEEIWNSIKPSLIEIQNILQKHFHLVANIFSAKVQSYKSINLKEIWIRLLDKKIRLNDDFWSVDALNIYISLISPQSVRLCILDVPQYDNYLGIGLMAEFMQQGKENNILNTEAILAKLKAISDPTRLEILLILSDGEKYARELADILNLTAPTISHHLSSLLDQDLLIIRADGGRTYYALAKAELNSLLNKIKLLLKLGD